MRGLGFSVLGFSDMYMCIYTYIPKTDNQTEKNMEHGMEAGTKVFTGIGVSQNQGYHAGSL